MQQFCSLVDKRFSLRRVEPKATPCEVDALNCQYLFSWTSNGSLHSSKWYAEDDSTVGSVDNLTHEAFRLIEKTWPCFRLPNVTSLPQNIFFEKAQQIFVHDKVELVNGCRALGSENECDNAEKKFVEISLKQQNSL